jgi:oligoribonuclease NrnB/cAMP/cGMP phosphodiesterase (DHH superfamily)
MNPRPLVIYHGNCADGFGAAWCFWRKFGQDADYVAGDYRRPPPDVTDRCVYLVDFSYKRAVVEQMLLVAAEVVLIDHHQTAIEDLKPLFRQDSWLGNPKQLAAYIDIERSGVMLAWNYLFPDEEPPRLLEHIQDRDLWKFRLPHTREIQATVFSHEYSFETWDRMMKADAVELMTMTVSGAAIERKHFKDIRELLSFSTRRMVIAGYDVPVANLPYTMASDAGNALAQGEPFAATYIDTATHRVFSLRSTEHGVDVAAIAEKFGGGGHARSSGFSVPRHDRLAME